MSKQTAYMIGFALVALGIFIELTVYPTFFMSEWASARLGGVVVVVGLVFTFIGGRLQAKERKARELRLYSLEMRVTELEQQRDRLPHR